MSVTGLSSRAVSGIEVGLVVGLTVGPFVGFGVGLCVGRGVGGIVGTSVGLGDGTGNGACVGLSVGKCVGWCVGLWIGAGVGWVVGDDVGFFVGPGTGDAVGFGDGTGVTGYVGETVGWNDGPGEGESVVSEGQRSLQPSQPKYSRQIGHCCPMYSSERSRRHISSHGQMQSTSRRHASHARSEPSIPLRCSIFFRALVPCSFVIACALHTALAHTASVARPRAPITTMLCWIPTSSTCSNWRFPSVSHSFRSR